MIDPNEPAFPGQEFSSEVGANSQLYRGLTIRAHFALHTMAGYMANPTAFPAEEDCETLEDMARAAARAAVIHADALIAELNK